VGHFFSRDVWARELTTLPTFRRWTYKWARVAYLATTNFVKDRCTWRASALTYITVLSLVPMLAFAFSVAKGLGAYDKLRTQTIEPLLDRVFGSNGASTPFVDGVERTAGSVTEADSVEGASEDGGATQGHAVEETEPVAFEGRREAAGDGMPERVREALGSAAPVPDVVTPPSADAPFVPDTETQTPTGAGKTEEETQSEEVKVANVVTKSEVRSAIDTVLHFVQSTNVASLGALGLAIVVWTVLSLLGSIERSFNDIWGVRRSRTIARKLSDYLSTIVLVPLFLVSATGLANLGKSTHLLQYLGVDTASRSVSYLVVLPVVALGFAFAYVFMPNTRVRIGSALIGGVVGGSLWLVFQGAHLSLQLGVANYNAIYSTFAALPIFLFWVYASWVTVLLGAEVAAAHQNEASHRQVVRARDYDQQLKRVVALRLAVRLAASFVSGAPLRSAEELAEDLGIPDRTLDEVVGALRTGRLLAVAELDGGNDRLVLVRDPARVRVQDVYDALDGLNGESDLRPVDALDEALDRALREYDEARRASPANRTLQDLAQAEIEAREAAAGEA